MPGLSSDPPVGGYSLFIMVTKVESLEGMEITPVDEGLTRQMS
jgi:hypothetical protein